MATTFVDYAGDGNNNKAFSFPSYQESDIKVHVDGVIKTTSTHYNITSYTTTGGGTVVFTAGNIPAVGEDIRIFRDTDVDSAKATFTAGSAVKAADLNNNTTQLLYAQQEEKNQNLTTDDLKDNIITSSKIVGNAVNSAHLADNSVGSSELQSDSVGTTQIKDNAVTSAKIAAGSLGTSSIADNAITSAKIAANAVGSAQIADGAVGSSELAANSVGSAQISDGAVGSSEIAADAVGAAQIADGAVGSAALAADSVGSAQIADGAVGASEIAADAVRAAQIQDGAVGSSEIAADAVGNAQLADNSVAAANIAANAVGSAQIADGAVGSSELDANSVGNVQMKDNAITMTEIGCEETTITDDDTKLPTSGAVVDYVASIINPIGGLEVIADDESFPNTIPAAGVVISITDAAGLSVNSSGVSTNGDALDNSTITINGFPSELRGGVGGNADPYVFASGAGLMVVSTGSSHTYNYHQAMIREADFVQLSDDINDFNSRYRIAGSAPGSNNDEGDLYFDTTANKMYVYDGSAWGQVTSTGEFKILGIKDNGQAHNGSGPTFNGSNDQYDLFEGTSDASLTAAAQLTVVLNGVVQKPNDGVFSGSEEGFYLDGTDGIKFCDPPPTGSTLFVIKSGSATEIAVPADNSVSAGKTDISLVQGDIIYSNGTDSWTRLAKGTAGQFLKMNSGATAPEWGADNDTIIGGANGVSFNDNVAVKFGTGTDNDLEIKHTPHVNMLEANDGSIAISADEIQLLSNDTAGQALYVDGPNNKLWLGYDGAHSIQITNTEATFIKDVVFDNATNAGKDLTWDMSDNALEFADDVKATFGDGADIQIYHNATNSFIKNSTGHFKICGDSLSFRNAADGEDLALFTADGACKLGYDNSFELETKSGGVKLNGHSESVITALTSASSVTIDFSLSNHFSCTMGHNITFANPTTESVGQSGTIVLTQDGTGSRTASWGSQFLWAGGTAPTLSTGANAVDRIDYFVAAADKIHCVASLGMA